MYLLLVSVRILETWAIIITAAGEIWSFMIESSMTWCTENPFVYVLFPFSVDKYQGRHIWVKCLEIWAAAKVCRASWTYFIENLYYMGLFALTHI